MNRWSLFLTLTAMMTVACSTNTRIYRPQSVRTDWFPNGRYEQQVQVWVEDHPAREFLTFIQKENQRIRVVALGPLKSTIFRLFSGPDTKEMDMEIYQPELQRWSSKIKEIYRGVGELLLLRWHPDGQERTQMKWESHGLMIQVQEQDSRQIPIRFLFQGKNYRVEVETLSYDLY